MYDVINSSIQTLQLTHIKLYDTNVHIQICMYTVARVIYVYISIYVRYVGVNLTRMLLRFEIVNVNMQATYNILSMYQVDLKGLPWIYTCICVYKYIQVRMCTCVCAIRNSFALCVRVTRVDKTLYLIELQGSALIYTLIYFFNNKNVYGKGAGEQSIRNTILFTKIIINEYNTVLYTLTTSYRQRLCAFM